MISLANENEVALTENTHYWCFLNDTFKLIKIKHVLVKEIVYELKDLVWNQNKVQIVETSAEEKKLPLKDKNLLKPFNFGHLYPYITDMSNISNISYPGILFNLKFKCELDLHYLIAGKLLTCLNLGSTDKGQLEEIASRILNIDTKINNSIIINGLPNTGKTKLSDHLVQKVLTNLTYRDYNILEDFQNAVKFLDIFGNVFESFERVNSSRYLRISKIYFPQDRNIVARVKIKHYLFEKNIIINKNSINFHIIHTLLEGFYEVLINDTQKIDCYELVKIIKENYSSQFRSDLIYEMYRSYNNFPEEFNDYLHKFYFSNFVDFLKICQNFKLSKKLFQYIIKTLLSILLLMKVDFNIDNEGKAIIDGENKLIEELSQFLSCEKELLIKRLTSREYHSPRGSFYVIKFTLDEASATRDNFIKFLYENLFEFLTTMTNYILNDLIREKVFKMSNEEFEKWWLNNDSSIRFIQTVECFGFENSSNPEKNSLENLFINYTNDKLNNLLFERGVKAEIELYQEEGIITNEFDYLTKKKLSLEASASQPSNTTSTTTNTNINTLNPNNNSGAVSKPRSSSIARPNFNKNNLIDGDIESTIEAIEDKSKGIFKLLDVQGSLINKGSIKALCDNIKLNWPNITTTTNSFYLVHYGSIVEYGASDFILKNIDSLNDDLKETSITFFKKFAKHVIANYNLDPESTKKNLLRFMEDKKGESNKSGSGTNFGNRRVSQNMKLKSNSDKFLVSIQKLLKGISLTNISFVRLLNTAPMKSEDNFDDKFVLRQLYSSGILESIVLAKGGYFIRYNYEKFLEKFAKFGQFSNESDIIENLARLLNIDTDDIVIGKSLIFIKNTCQQSNKDLVFCKNLPKYIIEKLFHILLHKFFLVFKISKYLLNSIRMKKLGLFVSQFGKILDKSKQKKTFNRIFNKFADKFNSALKIQTSYKVYKIRQDAAKIIQRALRAYIERLKIQKFDKFYNFISQYWKSLAYSNLFDFGFRREASAKSVQTAFRLYKEAKVSKKIYKFDKILKDYVRVALFRFTKDYGWRRNQCAVSIQKAFSQYKRVLKTKQLDKFKILLNKSFQKIGLNRIDNFGQTRLGKIHLLQKRVKAFVVRLKTNRFCVKFQEILNFKNYKMLMHILKLNRDFKVQCEENRRVASNLFEQIFRKNVENQNVQIFDYLGDYSQQRFQSIKIIQKYLKNLILQKKVQKMDSLLSKVDISSKGRRLIENLNNFANLKTEKAKSIQRSYKKFKFSRTLQKLISKSALAIKGVTLRKLYKFSLVKNSLNTLQLFKDNLDRKRVLYTLQSISTLDRLKQLVSKHKVCNFFKSWAFTKKLQKCHSNLNISLIRDSFKSIKIHSIKRNSQIKLIQKKLRQYNNKKQNLTKSLEMLQNLFENANFRIKSQLLLNFCKFQQVLFLTKVKKIQKLIRSKWKLGIIVRSINLVFSRRYLHRIKVSMDNLYSEKETRAKSKNFVFKEFFTNIKRDLELQKIVMKGRKQIVARIVNSLLNTLSRRNAKCIFTKYFTRQITTYLNSYTKTISKIKLLQKWTKDLFKCRIEARKGASNDMACIFYKFYLQHLMKDIRDYSAFLKSLDSNTATSNTEIFAVNFSNTNVLDNYIKEINKENISPKKVIRRKAVNKVNSTKILPTVMKSPNMTPTPTRLTTKIKPLTTKPLRLPSKNSINSETTKDKSQRPSPTKDMKPYIKASKKSINSIKQSTDKLKDNIIMFDQMNDKFNAFSDELDSLIKDISQDMNKLKLAGPHEPETDYIQLNKASHRKRNSVVHEKPKMESESTRLSHHIIHNAVDICGKFDKVTFKRICLKDMDKHI